MEVYEKKRRVFAYLVYRRLKNARKTRKTRVWVQPFVSSRLTSGKFATCFSSLRNNPERFRKYFSMSIPTFDELLDRITEKIKSQQSAMRLCISPAEMLAVTLRYLGSGCDQIDLHQSYRIGRSTLVSLLRKVCYAIWDTLDGECFPAPTEEKWQEIAAGFQKQIQFPNCIGAIGAKHISLRKPTKNGSKYWCRKNIHSLVFFAVVDAYYRLIYVEVGTFGRYSGDCVFENTKFYKHLQERTMNVPRGVPLPGTQAPIVSYAFAANDSFAVSGDVLRPYTASIVNQKKTYFNSRLERAHAYFESTMGIMSSRWKVFQKKINVDVEFATLIIRTCCDLHNFVGARDGHNTQDATRVQGFLEVADFGFLTASKISSGDRNALTDHFGSEVGRDPYQNVT